MELAQAAAAAGEPEPRVVGQEPGQGREQQQPQGEQEQAAGAGHEPLEEVSMRPPCHIDMEECTTLDRRGRTNESMCLKCHVEINNWHYRRQFESKQSACFYFLPNGACVY